MTMKRTFFALIVLSGGLFGQPSAPKTEFRGTSAELASSIPKDLVPDKNPIERITVTLPDGTEREAKLLARQRVI